MNRFADYFSNYVNDDTITYIGNGDITSFTVSRQDRELAVGLNLESFIDYGIIENSQNQPGKSFPPFRAPFFHPLFRAVSPASSGVVSP